MHKRACQVEEREENDIAKAKCSQGLGRYSFITGSDRAL